MSHNEREKTGKINKNDKYHSHLNSTFHLACHTLSSAFISVKML